jgi:hypothetical protein
MIKFKKVSSSQSSFEWLKRCSKVNVICFWWNLLLSKIKAVKHVWCEEWTWADDLNLGWGFCWLIGLKNNGGSLQLWLKAIMRVSMLHTCQFKNTFLYWVIHFVDDMTNIPWNLFSIHLSKVSPFLTTNYMGLCGAGEEAADNGKVWIVGTFKGINCRIHFTLGIPMCLFVIVCSKRWIDVGIHTNCLLTLFDNLSEWYGIFFMRSMWYSLCMRLSGTLP